MGADAASPHKFMELEKFSELEGVCRGAYIMVGARNFLELEVVALRYRWIFPLVSLELEFFGARVTLSLELEIFRNWKCS